MGGVLKTCGNSGGVGGGGLLLCSKNGNSGEEGGGDLREFPPWWGYGYFLELHNKLKSVIPSSLNESKIHSKMLNTSC